MENSSAVMETKSSAVALIDNDILKALRKREVGSSYGRMALIKYRFGKKITSKDTYQDKDNGVKYIKEVMVKHGFCVVLYKDGQCTAFSLLGARNFQILNQEYENHIRSIHYNKIQESLIMVSVSVSGFTNNSTFQCSSRRYSELLDEGADVTRLFETETLTEVHVDSLNSKIITRSANRRKFTVYGMMNYERLYDIDDIGGKMTSISIGMFLMVHEGDSKEELVIHSIEKGTTISSFPLRKIDDFDVMVLSHGKILVKQEKQQLQIIDVHTTKILDVSKNTFKDNSYCRVLHGLPLFLSCTGGKKNEGEVEEKGEVSVLDFMGNHVTSLEDHKLWYPYFDNRTFVTPDNNFIISYCKDKDGQAGGSMNINNIMTGKSISKMKISNGVEITAVYVAEDRNEIYTGNRIGEIHVYSY